MIFAALEEDEREERRPRSRYVSWREFLIILAVLLLLLVMLKPTLDEMGRRAEESACKRKLHAIGIAIGSYMIDHDDRLPATCYMGFDGAPSLVDGLPQTWVTDVQPKMSARDDFVCPSAKPSEATRQMSKLTGIKSATSTYGMYYGLSSVPINQVPNPGESLMIAETANLGALGSKDPVHFPGDISDGYFIGWDTGNLGFDRSTQSVTRLAFRDNPDKSVGGRIGRHGDVVFGISVEGGLRPLSESDAKVMHAAPRLKGAWWADPNLFR
ncbi:MAG: hypothetical protein JSS66_08950 [Armatimonadetes bacterium]|nr:hypothetical protein [Armatimonadota bacterium]